MAGALYDTYVAALQHGLAEIPAEAVRVGVVRRPTPWFYGEVDENMPALGPPEALLDEFKSRYEELQARGMDDATAHNAALDEIGYDDRYRDYLARSDEAQSAMETLRDRLDRGEDIALVCYENTDEKHCHRTLLKAALE